MRAVLSNQPGSPENLVLREIPDPCPGDGEVLIRVEACGINYPDLLMIEDRYQLRFKRPFSPGIEIAGTIEAVGPNVSPYQIGRRVAAQLPCGGLAERAVARAEQVFTVPTGVTSVQAAAILVTYATSYHALRDRAKLEAGQVLLVLGAAGGVGMAAVQLGKMMKAHVVAAVSSSQKADAARSAGADDIVIYSSAPSDPRALSALFKEACPQGADIIYDGVGGDYCVPALRSIAWHGRYLIVGFPSGIPKIPANLLLLKCCQVIGVFWGEETARDPGAAAVLINELFDSLSSGRIVAPAPSLYTLEDAVHALLALRDRKAIGKLVVTTRVKTQ